MIHIMTRLTNWSAIRRSNILFVFHWFGPRLIQSTIRNVRQTVCLWYCGKPTSRCPGDLWLKGASLKLACHYIFSSWLHFRQTKALDKVQASTYYFSGSYIRKKEFTLGRERILKFISLLIWHQYNRALILSPSHTIIALDPCQTLSK